MADNLAYLDPPYKYLDLDPGESLAFDVVGFRRGRSLPPAPGGRGSAGDETLRLLMRPPLGFNTSDYIDLVEPRLIASLDPLVTRPFLLPFRVRLTRTGVTSPAGYSISVERL